MATRHRPSAAGRNDRKTDPIPQPTQDRPRLGMVVRFAPQAGVNGVKQMERSGFRVASSSDFKTATAVPNDFDGADVQYFERFGIAVVRSEMDRLAPTMARSMQDKTVTSVRAERQYKTLGSAAGTQPAQTDDSGRGAGASSDYFRGYRDAVNQLVDRILDDGPSVARQKGPQLEESTTTWGLQIMKVPLSVLTGSGIRIAVLDTGFDGNHPDFQGRIITKKLFASHSSSDDIDGHGTHCIGTACGPLRPASGPRYGIAYESEIYAGKVLGDDGFGTDRSVIAGMDWALEQGCHVISMSLGAATRIGDQPNEDYERIGQVCLDVGTLVVAASGNESHRPGLVAPVGSPANASTIMSVGAIDRSMRIAPFSCGGMNPGQDVDIAGPGVDILSSLPGGRYDRWQGTSMATPHVAGIAALIAQSDAKYRGWALWARLEQLVRRLNLPARDVGKGLAQAPAN